MKKATYLFAFLVFCIIASCGQHQASSSNTYLTIDAGIFKEKLDTGNVELIDLRTLSEFNEGYISGAVHIDFYADDFEGEIIDLDKTKTYLIYCRSGGRSGKTLKFMREKEFQTVYNLEGGMSAWQSAGLPTIK